MKARCFPIVRRACAETGQSETNTSLLGMSFSRGVSPALEAQSPPEEEENERNTIHWKTNQELNEHLLLSLSQVRGATSVHVHP